MGQCVNKLTRTITLILAITLLTGCESTSKKAQRLETLKVTYQKSLEFLHAELRKHNAIAKFKVNAPNNSAKQVVINKLDTHK